MPPQPPGQGTPYWSAWTDYGDAVTLYDAASGSALQTFSIRDGDNSSSLPLPRLSPDGRAVLAFAPDRADRLEVWSATDGKRITGFDADGGRLAEFPPQGSDAVIIANGGALEWRGTDNGAVLHKVSLHRAQPAVFLTFFGDGRRLIAANSASASTEWDLETGQPASSPALLAEDARLISGRRAGGDCGAALISQKRRGL